MIIVKKHNYLSFGFKHDNNNNNNIRNHHRPPLLILVNYCLIIIIILSNKSNNNNKNDDANYHQATTTTRHMIGAYAQVMQIPRPEAMYGSSETGTSPMEDLEDEDDDGMDADASDAYGTADQDSDDDENFGGDGYGFDSAESKLTWKTIVPPSSKQQQTNNYTNHSPAPNSSIIHLYDGPNDDHEIRTVVVMRIKRDLNDISNKAKNHQKRQRQDKVAMNNNDYGEDESWVHDGVDDIFVDPETKNAASELSYDEKSIDAEYAPYQQRQQQNRTRLTTITEVIPIINNDDDENENDDDDSDKENQDSSSRIDIEHIEPAANGQQHQQALISGTNTPTHGQQRLTGDQQVGTDGGGGSSSDYRMQLPFAATVVGAGVGAGAGAGAAINEATAGSLSGQEQVQARGANFMMAPEPINNVNWLNNGAAAADQYLMGYNNGAGHIGGQNELSVLATMLATNNNNVNNNNVRQQQQQQMAQIFGENQAPNQAYNTNQYIIKTIPYNEIR